MKIVTLAVFLLVGPWLQATVPTWAGRLTSSIPGNHPEIQPQKLVYSLSWNGQVAAGSVEFTFGSKGSNDHTLHCFCEGGSQGIAAKAFPYRFDMSGKVLRKTLLPQLVHCNETDKEETLVTTVKFQGSDIHVTEISRPHSTGRDTTKNKDFSYAPVFDAFSSMLLIRSHALKQGESLTQVIHPFKTPYLSTIQVVGREKMHGRDAIKLNIALEKIQSDMTLKPYAKMKTATLWISDDHHRVPLELRVAAFIGDVRMTLRKQELQ
jgi:hypothetical protein